MSNRNPNVTNHDVIPVFSPMGTIDVFGDTEARFAVGQIAQSVLTDMPRNGYEAGTRALANFPGRVIEGFTNAVHNYGVLRANVYIDQTQMLTEEVRNSKGEEWDLDDARSDHFVTIERLYAEDPLVRDIVERDSVEPDGNGFVFRLPNCMRMIKKSLKHRGELPIELFFPDAKNPTTGEASFPAPIGSIEMSRKIAVHENPLTGMKMSDPMFKVTDIHVIENGYGPTFATIEEFYEDIFKKTGMPMDRIADPKFVGEYADNNLGIEIYHRKLAEKLGVTVVRAEAQTTQPFMLYGTVPSLKTAA
jgi:hypothetical protein